MEETKNIIEGLLGKSISESSSEELYEALLSYTQSLTESRPENKGERKLYYISAEFLIGKLLSNNMINLGIYEEIKAILEGCGKSLSDVEEAEPEPSLGNGGLGRLAACFLDSIAALGLPGDGIGLNYHYGLFKQIIKDNKQHEVPNPWIEEKSWLKKTDRNFTVKFKDFELPAIMYDIDIAGYDNGSGKLHLFDIETLDDSIITDGIDFDKTQIDKNLTMFLYPDDSDEAGELLRIYQQYFMVSCGAQLVMAELRERGYEPKDLAKYAVIQINDTHPSLVIPELVRLLTAEGIEAGMAMDIVSQTCAYTNHTILAEALEKWPLSYLEKTVPHLVPIIKELDARIKTIYPPQPEEESDEKQQDEAEEKPAAKKGIYIIDSDDIVHMAHMDIHYSFSVNGVAALHTKILMEEELKEFNAIYPGKFNNKTNGITFRRWLMHANPLLANYLDSLIGDGWRKDAGRLKKLLDYKDDKETLNKLIEIKQLNKKALTKYLADFQGIHLDENSVFDIQTKRLHEYKRQQMNALYAIYKYKEIKAGRLPKRPITMLFGAKAAPAYTLAKDIIHLILCLEQLCACDEEVSPWLKVVMTENYNVDLAEKLIPACDISEQISLASKEASGTGNMKFMLNGAVTLGTEDGANVEIHELVGDENIYIFGQSSDKVIEMYNEESYDPLALYDSDPQIEDLADFIINKKMIRIGDPVCLARLYKDLISKDWFMALLDLKDYISAKERALEDFEDREAWAKKTLVNIANAGYFSSDRTISQYNQDIWKLK